MRIFYYLSISTSLIFCHTVNAQPYTTEANGDAVINPGGVYCVVGGMLRVEKGREGQAADIVVDPGRGCSYTHTGKILLNGATRVGGAFEVAGNVHALNKVYAKRVEILDPVPRADYVFANDYPLLPINAVESFIKENRHLPNIPSAAQVKDKGYDIGEMDNLLLEKVEELTLYIIQQEKRIKELESKLND